MKISDLYICTDCVNVILLDNPTNYPKKRVDAILTLASDNMKALKGDISLGDSALAQEFGTCPCALCNTKEEGLRIHYTLSQ